MSSPYRQFVVARIESVVVAALLVGSGLVVDGLLSAKPQSKAAVIGSRAVLTCGTTLPNKTVNWSQRPVGTLSNLATNRIFVHGEIPDAKKSRYQTESPAPGRFDLVILSVDESDAGLYMCRDDSGFGDDSAIVQLIVIASTQSCRSNITSSAVAQSQDDAQPSKGGVVDGESVHIVCQIDFVGNVVPSVALLAAWPEMEIAVTDASSPSSSGRGRVAASGTMRVRVDDAARQEPVCAGSCNCSLVRDDNRASSSGNSDHKLAAVTPARLANCHPSVDVLRPVDNVRIDNRSSNGLHFVGEAFICRADGSPPPTYRWTDLTAAGLPVDPLTATVDGPRLTLVSPGIREFACTASNVVRGIEYNATTTMRVVAVTIDVPSRPATMASALDATTPLSDEASLLTFIRDNLVIVIVVASVTVLICVVLSAVAVFVCGCRRRRRNRRRSDQQPIAAAASEHGGTWLKQRQVADAEAVADDEPMNIYSTIEDRRSGRADYQALTLDARRPVPPPPLADYEIPVVDDGGHADV